MLASSEMPSPGSRRLPFRAPIGPYLAVNRVTLCEPRIPLALGPAHLLPTLSRADVSPPDHHSSTHSLPSASVQHLQHQQEAMLAPLPSQYQLQQQQQSQQQQEQEQEQHRRQHQQQQQQQHHAYEHQQEQYTHVPQHQMHSSNVTDSDVRSSSSGHGMPPMPGRLKVAPNPMSIRRTRRLSRVGSMTRELSSPPSVL